MDKLSPAALARPPLESTGGRRAARGGRGLSRRGWLRAALGFGSGALGLEVLSLGGTWDHRSARVRAAPPAPPLAPGVPRLTHVGHSCHLFEISGQRWLTDPWFYNPAFGSLVHESGLAVEAVGPLDGIFVSHRHPDHFDPRALAQLDKRARVWTPDPSLLTPLRELGFGNVQLSHAWETFNVGQVEVSFTPAEHDVPEHSLVLASPEARVLFCGDTGPHHLWAEIRRRYRPTTALLPCDATALRWEPRLIMDAEEAARAAEVLGCPQVFQTHADATYGDPVARHLLSTTSPEPVASLERALGTLCPAPFQPLAIGETRRLFSPDSITL